MSLCDLLVMLAEGGETSVISWMVLSCIILLVGVIIYCCRHAVVITYEDIDDWEDAEYCDYSESESNGHLYLVGENNKNAAG